MLQDCISKTTKTVLPKWFICDCHFDVATEHLLAQQQSWRLWSQRIRTKTEVQISSLGGMARLMHQERRGEPNKVPTSYVLEKMEKRHCFFAEKHWTKIIIQEIGERKALQNQRQSISRLYRKHMTVQISRSWEPPSGQFCLEKLENQQICDVDKALHLQNNCRMPQICLSIFIP